MPQLLDYTNSSNNGSEPTPLDLALAALTRLIATGPAPERVTAAIGTLVAGWADEEEMTPEVMRDRAGQLWDGFSTQAAALQEQLSDAGENGPEAPLGRKVLAALETAAETFAAISGR